MTPMISWSRLLLSTASPAVRIPAACSVAAGLALTLVVIALSGKTALAGPVKAPLSPQQAPLRQAPSSSVPATGARQPTQPAVDQEQAQVRELMLKGEALFASKSWQEAVLVFQQVLSLRPTAVNAHGWLADCYFELGQIEAARQHYRLFLANASEKILSKERRADVLQRLDEIERRIQASIKPQIVFVRAPSRPRWQLGLGASLLSLGGVLIGFGVPALVLDGQCVRKAELPGAPCPALYDTRTLGIGLTASGGALALAGLVTLVWPPRRVPEPVVTRGLEPAARTGAIGATWGLERSTLVLKESD